jgi:hypothetical protein
VVEGIVGERGRRVAVEAAGHVAPGIVAAGVDLARFVGARSPGRIEAGQLIKILVLGTAAIERSLPELAQVGVDIGRTVAGEPVIFYTVLFVEVVLLITSVFYSSSFKRYFSFSKASS